jgi:cytoskeletal protein RodZ
LSDVSEQIHIRSVYLQSIEDEDWAAIAAPVYVRGFLRTYARFLGLDPEASVEAYNEAIDQADRVASGPLRVTPNRRSGPSLWLIVAALAAIILVVFVGYSYYKLQTGTDATQTATNPGVPGIPTDSPAPGLGAATDAAASPAAATEGSPVPGASDSATAGPDDALATPQASPSATPGGRTLEVRLTQVSWIRVAVDGKPLLEGTFPAGTQKAFHGKSASIRTGNAGGVDVTVNGKDVGAMGKSGDVVEKTFALGAE